MAADLHIHVVDEVPDRILRIFNADLFPPVISDVPEYSGAERDEAFGIMVNTVNLWVGRVSWLKAALTRDPTSYVPDLVQIVAEVIPPYPPVVVDEGLLASLETALQQVKNAPEYYKTEDPATVLAWLRDHRGCRVVTVSW
jgi:hypothetical protein